MGRILVVDDDPQVLKLFSLILTKGGYAVVTANSGKKAIAHLENGERLDAMVLDLSMPEPDGFEILKEMRRARPGLRIVVASGFLGGALLRASELLGAAASFSKSDAPGRLLETINQVLQ